MAQPAGLRVSTRPSLVEHRHAVVHVAEELLVAAQLRSSRSAATRCRCSLWMRPALRSATAAALATVGGTRLRAR